MKILLSISNQAGDIPTYDLTKNKLIEQLSLSNDKVFVSFLSDLEAKRNDDFSEEHKAFLISSCVVETVNYLFDQSDLQKSFSFNCFCFENYYEAFNYCIDLKDGTE
jgi:DNA gyrase/topoisomerase IV subunit A